MSLRGAGLLAIWNDIEPSVEADFNRWYSEQHFPERLAVPGFLRGRRYVAASDGKLPKYAAIYETETAEVLASGPYRQRLDNPTPWSKRLFTHFRNTARGVYRIVASHGYGVGGAMRTCWLPADALSDAADPAQRLVETPGIVAAHVLEADADISSRRSSEGALRATADQVPARVLIVESMTPADLAVTDPHVAHAIAQRDYRLIHSAAVGKIRDLGS